MQKTSQNLPSDPVQKAAEDRLAAGNPLHRAQTRLDTVEKLLLHPTPKAIRDSELLVQETSILLHQCGMQGADRSTPENGDLKSELEQFQRSCKRVDNLLQGALRVQVARMRSIGSFTQTYTSAAKTKNWTPKAGSINFQF